MADPLSSSTPPPYTESPIPEEYTLEPHKDSFDALALAPPPPSRASSFCSDRDYDSEEDLTYCRRMHKDPHLPTPRSTIFINTSLFALALILIQLSVILPYLVWSYFTGFQTDHGLRTTREFCLVSSWLSCSVFCIAVLYHWRSEPPNIRAPVSWELAMGSITAEEMDQRLHESYVRRFYPPLTLREVMLKYFVLIVLAWLLVTGMVTETCIVLAISEAGWRLIGVL